VDTELETHICQSLKKKLKEEESNKEKWIQCNNNKKWDSG